ncbi:MAG: ABC transporter permease subunit, partial [Anaerolineales bacterium]|nr:ABC transporter permease subunit [Anaerolineales bacterium]
MATTSPNAPQGQQRIPPWRDIRIIGVFAQLVFIALTIVAGYWFFNNISNNIDTLGEAQFICRDGSSSFRCAFDFMSSQAQFDISETTLLEYEPSDSYWDALGVAFLNTIKVIVLGVILTTIVGTLAGIARLSSNWLVSNVARAYVDLFRNTPLVLQLIFIYFSVILALPAIQEALKLPAVSVYMSQRGLNYPSPVMMLSFSTWFAFLVLAVIQAQVVWVLLGKYEENSGRQINRPAWVITAFFSVAFLGWFVASNDVNQSVLTPAGLRVQSAEDFEQLVLGRLDVNLLDDIERALAAGTLTQDDVDAAAVSICAVRDSASEVNLTSLLQGANVPYVVERFRRQDQATEAYAAGECEVLAASTAVLAGERNLLENPTGHNLTAVHETPMRISTPKIEGFNFVGGGRMSAEFTALLIGLVLNTGASVAEIVRAGIQSVGKGQSEAARALGLSESQRLRLVVLPQALRVIVPPQTSQYLNLAK